MFRINQLKNCIKILIPKKHRKPLARWKNLIFDGYAIKSYSQEGEDMILRRVFEEKKTGFYVDVGAHHPKRFSNTYYFYKKGWKGINIEVTPGSSKIFRKMRLRDLNLEIAISDKKEVLTLYCLNDSALNTFSRDLALTRCKDGRYKIIDKLKIETSTLAEVLDTYLPDNLEIDFLSVDVEGFDLKVLKSNNWSKYRPKVVLVESLDTSLDEVNNSDVYRFLTDMGYRLFAKSFNTLFFMNNSFREQRWRRS